MSKTEKNGQMGNTNLAVVILAGGKGSRFKTRRPKVLHAVGGKTLLAHAVAAATRLAPPDDIFVVISAGDEQVRNTLDGSGVKVLEQPESRGTGSALQCARDAIAGYELVVVLPSDMPLLQTETLVKLERLHRAENAAMTLVNEPYAKPADETTTGICAFKTQRLLEHLDELRAKKPHGEVSLTDMAAILRAAGESVANVASTEVDEVLHAGTIADLVLLDAKMRVGIAHRLMDAGVTIYRPETCVIDADVEVGADTVIEPFVQLLGSTKIGTGCQIRSYSVLESCTLGNNVLIRPSCVLTESSIADRAEIGPFSRMRPGCEVGEQAHIGNFVELKKAKLKKGVKAGHLAYLGDAEIGENVNVGAGVITCNYDGVLKHVTRVGDGAFVGSDSTLVAPLTVGAGSYIGAGSCITRDVPPDALALGRAQQVTKEGWAVERRARQKAEARIAKETDVPAKKDRVPEPH